MSLGELVANSAFPALTTDYVMERSGPVTDRMVIPVLDEEASVTYYCACLKEEKARLPSGFRVLPSALPAPAQGGFDLL